MIKINYKKIIEKFSEIGDKDKLKSILTPFRDWKIIIAVFLLSFVLLVVASIYFFMLVNTEKIFFKKIDGTVKKLSVMNIPELKKTIDFFDNKAEKFKSLTDKKPKVVDPSL